MTDHDHNDCPKPSRGNTCSSGILRSYCDFDGCDNPDCVDAGHCTCACHEGQTCHCGYEWPFLAALDGDTPKETT